MKHVFKQRHALARAATSIADRKDKMGFPVPLHEWMRRPGARVRHATSSRREAALEREHCRQPQGARRARAGEPRFGRKIWGLLSPRALAAAFHDREHEFKNLLTTKGTRQ